MKNFGKLIACFALIGLFASPVAAQSLDEFIMQFSDLAGDENKADEILRLCDEALAGSAEGNARYTATALGYRSHAFYLKKDIKTAEDLALQAVAADPTSALAHFIYTDVLYELERFDEARESCLKAADMMEPAEHRDNLRQLCENAYTFRTMEAQAPTKPDAPAPEKTEASPTTEPDTKAAEDPVKTK